MPLLRPSTVLHNSDASDASTIVLITTMGTVNTRLRPTDFPIPVVGRDCILRKVVFRERVTLHAHIRHREVILTARFAQKLPDIRNALP